MPTWCAQWPAKLTAHCWQSFGHTLSAPITTKSDKWWRIGYLASWVRMGQCFSEHNFPGCTTTHPGGLGRQWLAHVVWCAMVHCEIERAALALNPRALMQRILTWHVTWHEILLHCSICACHPMVFMVIHWHECYAKPSALLLWSVQLQLSVQLIVTWWKQLHLLN